MHTSALLLHALKGTCALNCLAALHLAGPQPVTQRAVMDLTGFQDGAVRKGLHTLLVLGLVTCSGEERRSFWQLAPAARELSWPLAPRRPSPENVDSQLLKEEEQEREKETDLIILLDSSLGVEAANPENRDCGDTLSGSPPPPAQLPTPAPSANTGVTPGRVPVTNDEHLPPAIALGLERAHHKALRRQFYIAFEAADIYLQFRRPLAEALEADDGPAGLRQTLGWICYAQRRLPHIKRGAVVYISLRDRLPCDPAYLPPPELAFEAALAWALRGGEAAPEPDGEADPIIRVSPAPNVPDTPEDQLWHTVLERLSLELPPSVVAAHLCALRPVALDDRRCVLAAPTSQSRDWLTRRLGDVVARALGEQTGRNMKVEFICD